MSLIARTYEKQALAIHYVVRGGLPFVDRAAALRVVVAAQDEIVRLRDQLQGAIKTLERIRDHANSAEEAALLAQHELDRISAV
jgi:hypothetical protein